MRSSSKDKSNNLNQGALFHCVWVQTLCTGCVKSIEESSRLLGMSEVAWTLTCPLLWCMSPPYLHMPFILLKGLFSCWCNCGKTVNNFHSKTLNIFCSYQAFTSGLRKYLQYYRACVLSTPPTLSLLTISFLFRKLGRQLR